MGRRNTKGEIKPPAGSKARVIADISRYLERADEPMVAHGIAGQLDSTRGMNVAPSKMFEDEGYKLKVVAALAERGATATMPRTRDGIIDSLKEFLSFCLHNRVPPTLGGFAVWNGVSVQRINQVERDKNDERSPAISFAKDTIRNFLELAAMDSSLNPIVYFHQNKVYYGAIENQTVTLQLEHNAVDLSPEEQRERVRLLLASADDVVDVE